MENRETIQWGTSGRVNPKQHLLETTGIPKHQSRRFRVTKRENTFSVSTGLLSSFPDVSILSFVYEKPMCAFLTINKIVETAQAPVP